MIGSPPIALAPDPSLPSRDVPLDESAMRDRLRALGSGSNANVIQCTLARVNYQVGKSLRATFWIVTDEGPQTVALRMFREGKSAEAFARAASRARPYGGLRGIV